MPPLPERDGQTLPEVQSTSLQPVPDPAFSSNVPSVRVPERVRTAKGCGCARKAARTQEEKQTTTTGEQPFYSDPPWTENALEQGAIACLSLSVLIVCSTVWKHWQPLRRLRIWRWRATRSFRSWWASSAALLLSVGSLCVQRYSRKKDAPAETTTRPENKDCNHSEELATENKATEARVDDDWFSAGGFDDE